MPKISLASFQISKLIFLNIKILAFFPFAFRCHPRTFLWPFLNSSTHTESANSNRNEDLRMRAICYGGDNFEFKS